MVAPLFAARFLHSVFLHPPEPRVDVQMLLGMRDALQAWGGAHHVAALAPRSQVEPVLQRRLLPPTRRVDQRRGQDRAGDAGHRRGGLDKHRRLGARRSGLRVNL